MPEDDQPAADAGPDADARERVVRAAAAGFAPPPLDPGDEPPTQEEIAAAKRAVREHLDAPDRMASYWQLADAVDADHYTLRVALSELADAGDVRPAAVLWRPDRTDGEGPPVAGPVANAGEDADG